jgi:integrase
MPQRKQLAHVERIRVKGKTYWYVKVRGVRRGRLPGDENSPEWLEAYAQIMRGVVTERSRTPNAYGSVGWLIQEYTASKAYAKLAPATRESYSRNLEHLRTLASFPATDIKRAHIRRLREAMADTPRAQHLFTQVAARLFSWGISDRDLEMSNPAAKMKREDAPESYAAWSEAEMQAFEGSGPPRAAMSAYMLARYAGARRTDLAGLRRSSYDGLAISIPGTKTDTPVTVPAHPRLKAYLDSLPPTLYLITDEHGRPVKANTLSKVMRAHLDKIGLSHLTLHGLRHTAGQALAEAGCSPHEIAAVLGHRTLQMVQHYTKKARQGRLAASAIVKLRTRDES